MVSCSDHGVLFVGRAGPAVASRALVPGRGRAPSVIVGAASWRSSAVSSAMVSLARLASERFSCAQTGSTGLSSWAYGGSRYTVSHGRAAISSANAALTWVLRVSHTSTIGPPSCRRRRETGRRGGLGDPLAPPAAAATA